MKLIIDGNINIYYVQTLCMIFFPGAKFAQDEEVTDSTPVLNLHVEEREDGVYARAELSLGDKTTFGEKFAAYADFPTSERTHKVAVGGAVVGAGGDMMGYRPSWGMLTGVRPSKVAMEMLNSGISKTRTKKILSGDYCVIPKKAALAVSVALNESKLIGTPDKRDCSIYISIPFCPTRCAYCSFVSYTSKRLLSLIPEYLEKLCRDIDETFKTVRDLGLNVKTVYIGGGTPTILTSEQLRLLLSKIEGHISASEIEEYTLESGRPDTIDAEKLAVARGYGVNRISVNPQILCDDVLCGIGRNHTSEDFMRAYNTARESGIKYINTDLIAGLPGDRFLTFSSSFDRILALEPDNITVHTFCVKKSADLLKRESHIYSLRGGDAGKCIDYSQIKAQQAGYIPYYMYRQKNTVGNFENVGFAKEGAEGLYNIYMMEEVHSIFSAGAGAVTKLVSYGSLGEGKSYIKRIFNPKYPYEYLRDDNTEQKRATINAFYEDLLK